jgi:SAM-dependent methyltransferase
MNIFLSRRYEAGRARTEPMPMPPRDADYHEAEAKLRLVQPDDAAARAYLEKHIERLARTLTLVPPASGGRRALELGCYMQITPLLAELRGYKEVRGASQGTLGERLNRVALVAGRAFECAIDLFDAERDRFPYEDRSFELVLVCEMIEHMVRDPMHLLLEGRRVLEEGGRILITTPNIGSLTSVARTLHGYDNPQIFYQYSRPVPGEPTEIQHVREYTAFELRDAVRAAGFEVETLIAEPIANLAENLSMWNFLEEHGYNTEYRGEQIYCIGVKRRELPVTRYPKFLYVEE